MALPGAVRAELAAHLHADSLCQGVRHARVIAQRSPPRSLGRIRGCPEWLSRWTSCPRRGPRAHRACCIERGSPVFKESSVCGARASALQADLAASSRVERGLETGSNLGLRLPPRLPQGARAGAPGLQFALALWSLGQDVLRKVAKTSGSRRLQEPLDLEPTSPGNPLMVPALGLGHAFGQG